MLGNEWNHDAWPATQIELVAEMRRWFIHVVDSFTSIARMDLQVVPQAEPALPAAVAVGQPRLVQVCTDAQVIQTQF